MKNAKYDMNTGEIFVKIGNMPRPVFEKLKEIIKRCDGSWYNDIGRFWTITASNRNAKILHRYDFQLDDKIRDLLPKETVLETAVTPLADLTNEQKNILDNRLRNYQIDGIRFFIAVNGVGILGDDMGLGKTVQSIQYVVLENIKPVLIVCPSSLKLNWEREIKKWSNTSVYILDGRESHDVPLDNSFYIINYAILAKSFKMTDKRGKKINKLDGGWYSYIIGKIKPRALIIDECQKIGNETTIRTKAILELAKNIDKKLFLSGTPIQNNTAEFFTCLNLINPMLFPNRWKYYWRYCDPKNNGFGWTFTGSSNLRELRQKIIPLMLRRRKQDVLTELPAKTKIIIPLECDQIAFNTYTLELKKSKKRIKQTSKNVLKRKNIEELKRLAYQCKRRSVIGWIRDFLETGKKLVVFGYHRQVLEDLKEHFGNQSVLLYGGMTTKEKQLSVDLFQHDDSIRLLFGNLKAGGLGYTLTAASHLCFIEYWWNPKMHEQCEDRCHRITQKDNVTIYYLIAQNTIELNIIELLEKKNKIVSQLLDGSENSLLQTDILHELLLQMEYEKDSLRLLNSK